METLAIAFATLNLAVAAFLTKKAWARRSPAALCYISFAVLFGMAQIAELALGKPAWAESYNLKVTVFGQIVALATVIGLGAGQFLFARPNRTGRARRTINFLLRSHNPETLNVVRTICIILASCGYVILFFYGPMSVGEMIATDRMAVRAGQTGALVFFGRGLPVLGTVAVYLAIAARPIRWTTLAVSAVETVAAATLFGDRSFTLYFIAPVILHTLCEVRNRARAAAAALVVGTVFVFFVVGALHVHRWGQQRDLAALIDTVESGDAVSFLWNSEASDLNIRYVLYRAVEIFPNEAEWLYGNTYWTMLIFWLPRDWIGDAKTDTMYHFAFALTGDASVYETRGSAHPTLPGDLYINLGPLFFAGALAWGLAFRGIDRLLANYPGSIARTCIAATWALFLILAVRGSIYQPFVNVAMCTGIVSIIISLFRRQAKTAEAKSVPSSCDIAILASTPDVHDIRISKMTTSLRNAGYKVCVVMASGTSIERDGVVWYGVAPARSRRERFITTPLLVARRAIALRPRVMTFCNAEFTPIMLILAMSGKSVVFDIWEDWYSEIDAKPWLPQRLRALIASLYRRFETIAIKCYAGVIAAGIEVEERVACIAKQAVLIHNYPRLEYAVPTCENDPTTSHIFCAGGLRAEACTDIVIRALGTISASTPVKLKLVGREGTPEFVEKLTAEPGWQHVEYFGLVNSQFAKELLAKSFASIVLYSPRPNHRDVRSNKVYEAMAAGRAVIAPNYPRWKALIDQTSCGISVDPTSAESVSTAIQQLILSPAERQTMGRNGSAAFRKTYNWEAQEQALIAFYRAILKEESHSDQRPPV